MAEDRDAATLNAASKLASDILLLVARVTDEYGGDPECNVIIVAGFVEALAAVECAMPRAEGRESFSRSLFRLLRKVRAN